jgi:hypothetical protein
LAIEKIKIFPISIFVKKFLFVKVFCAPVFWTFISWNSDYPVTRPIVKGKRFCKTGNLFSQGYFGILLPAITQVAYFYFVFRVKFIYSNGKVVAGVYFFFANFCYNIIFLQAGFFCRAVFFY